MVQRMYSSHMKILWEKKILRTKTGTCLTIRVCLHSEHTEPKVVNMTHVGSKQKCPLDRNVLVTIYCYCSMFNPPHIWLCDVLPPPALFELSTAHSCRRQREDIAAAIVATISSSSKNEGAHPREESHDVFFGHCALSGVRDVVGIPHRPPCTSMRLHRPGGAGKAPRWQWINQSAGWLRTLPSSPPQFSQPANAPNEGGEPKANCYGN